MSIIYDKKLKRYVTEKNHNNRIIKILYDTTFGRILLKFIFARPWFSKLMALYRKSELSQGKILPFIEKYKINTEGYDISTMKSFNDFFIRKRKIEVDKGANKQDLVAIADAKLSAYDITRGLKINIKNSTYTLEELLGNSSLAKHFSGGTCLVYRMSVDDYHRYHYLDSGILKLDYKIKGKLHVIHPVASKYKVFSRNTRAVSLMKTDTFGNVVQVEVGAMLVGCIKNHDNGVVFNRLEEKGYFEYGGSTIILLFEKDTIELDRDIQVCSKRNLEVKVRIGETIGHLK